MLARLHVQNFKCLRDVDIAFGPFTVLIGPNDSGKSSILDALRILGRTMREPLADIFRGDDEWRHLAWKGDKVSMILLAVHLVNGAHRHDYSITVSRGSVVEEFVHDQNGLGGGPLPPRDRTRLSDWIFAAETGREAGRYATPLDAAVDTVIHDLYGEHTQDVLALAAAPRYRLNPEHLRRPATTSRAAVLTATGDNLAAVLDRIISGPDRTAITRLEQALHEAIPTLRGIALPAVDDTSGAKALEFVLDAPQKGPPVTIPCAQASDGAMLLTAFLALAFSDEPGILLIEEPENGLHPSRLREVVEMLRKISTGAVGNTPRQVIVTTHSPLLLNYTQPEEVRIVQRDRERGTIVTPMSDVPDVHELLDEFGTGELWYLLGEQALVEGKKP